MIVYRGLRLVERKDNGNAWVDLFDAGGLIVESMSVPNDADPIEFAKGEIDEFFAGAHSL